MINDVARAYDGVMPAEELRVQTARPLLVGTLTDAVWTIRFYKNHGFELTPAEEKAALLRRYWSVPKRQIETSVVLAERGWLAGAGAA